jgi:ribonuclease P protein component
MSSSRDFTEVTRAGARAGSTTLVAHLLLSADDGPTPARIGFIVNRAVGSAATRNRVRRRLRHLCRPLVPELRPGTRLVVRALPPAASADSTQLAADLASSVRRAGREAERAVGA